jgi:hypothetical protein
MANALGGDDVSGGTIRDKHLRCFGHIEGRIRFSGLRALWMNATSRKSVTHIRPRR